MTRLSSAALEASAVVGVPFDAIDPIFLRPEGLPLWDASVARVELRSTGPFRQGFRFDTIGPRREKRSSYVALELTPSSWRSRLLDSRVLAAAVWTMRFEPLGARTKVTVSVEMTLRRRFAPLAFLFRRLTPRLERDMRLLEAAIERRAVSGAPPREV
jgi:Polyketide cyclase / dehydrase and lipid transport